MKRYLILSILALLPLMSAAQFGFAKHEVGLRGGVVVSDVILSDPGYVSYGHLPHIDFSYGLTSRHRLKEKLTLRTDLIYAGRGGHLYWCDVDYQLSLKYIDLRFPLQYNFHIPWHEYSPFIAAGPMVNITHQGTIGYTSDPTGDLSLEVDRGSARMFDIGLLGLVGIDLPFDIARRTFYLTVEAGYGIGLVNSFSRAESRGQAAVANTDLDDMANYGSRHNHGLEVALAFSVPLQKRKPKKQPYDRSANYHEVEQVEQPVEEDEPIEVEYKECYTIDDIIRYLDASIDIVGMKICLFDINFDFDSYDLNGGVRENLKKFARVMDAYPEMRVCVNGHTDSIGSHEYNDKLSNNRAKEVRGYIGSRGIDLNRIDYKGYGKRVPIESNDTEWGRHRNRRVEIEILYVGNKRSNEEENEE